MAKEKRGERMKKIGNALLYLPAPIILAVMYWLISGNKDFVIINLIFLSGLISELVLSGIRLIKDTSGTINITESEGRIRWDFQLTKEPEDIAKKESIIIYIKDGRGKNGTIQGYGVS